MCRWTRQLQAERDARLAFSADQPIPLSANPITNEQQYIHEIEERIKGLERNREIRKKAPASLMLDFVRP